MPPAPLLPACGSIDGRQPCLLLRWTPLPAGRVHDLHWGVPNDGSDALHSAQLCIHIVTLTDKKPQAPAAMTSAKGSTLAVRCFAGRGTGKDFRVDVLRADDSVRGAGRYEHQVDAVIVEVLLLQHKRRPAAAPVEHMEYISVSCQLHLNDLLQCTHGLCCLFVRVCPTSGRRPQKQQTCTLVTTEH